MLFISILLSVWFVVWLYFTTTNHFALLFIANIATKFDDELDEELDKEDDLQTE